MQKLSFYHLLRAHPCTDTEKQPPRILAHRKQWENFSKKTLVLALSPKTKQYKNLPIQAAKGEKLNASKTQKTSNYTSMQSRNTERLL